MGAADQLEICLSFTCVKLTCQISSFYVKPYKRNYADPPETFDPPRVPPFKVTETDTGRSATYGMVWYTIGFNVPLDTVQVIPETGIEVTYTTPC